MPDNRESDRIKVTVEMSQQGKPDTNRIEDHPARVSVLVPAKGPAREKFFVPPDEPCLSCGEPINRHGKVDVQVLEEIERPQAP